MSDGKIVITGTGRAGTTLLVAMLTDLGMDTGYRPGIEAKRSGGLEGDIERPDAPRVVKAPTLSLGLREVLDRGNVRVEHVIIPVRDLDIAAASRVRVAGYGRNPATRGGLWATRRPSRRARGARRDAVPTRPHARRVRPAPHLPRLPAFHPRLEVHLRQARLPRAGEDGRRFPPGDRSSVRPFGDP